MPLASPAPAGKHPDAFRTISEVAEDLAVPQHVLRFWESRFGQIRPLKRAGGRRFYRPQDVELVAGIRHLLHIQRYTIEGAQRVLKENGVRFVQAVGRGEAVVATPQEAVPRDAASRDVVSRAVGTSISGDTPAETRALLRALLAELNACRDALSALRRPPDDPG